jgi:hypothetical protein
MIFNFDSKEKRNSLLFVTKSKQQCLLQKRNHRESGDFFVYGGIKKIV